MTITKERFDYIVRYSHNLDKLIEDLSTANHRIKSEINKTSPDTVLVNSSIYYAKSSLETFNKGNK